MPKKLAHLTIKGKNVSLELCTYECNRFLEVNGMQLKGDNR